MGTYIRPDKAIRENIIVKMEEDRDAIQAAFAQATHIEHSVDFVHDVPPIGGDVRIRVAGGNLTPHFGTCCCMPPGIAGGSTVDIRLGTPGGPSILTAPAPIDATPGIPVPLVFIPGVVIPVGIPICYILADNGNPVFFPTMHVEYVKDVVPVP